jgi:2'-phosphotransferase
MVNSKTLSYILRHGAVKEGLTISPDGYVSLNELLQHRQFKDTNFETIKGIVNSDNKNRFTLKLENGKYFIRANQGHSTEVGTKINDQELLTEITTPIDNCFHGTYKSYLPLIEKEGLKTMSRKHIHFATSLHAKSGKRNDCNAFLYLDMRSAMNDGIKFYMSENGVVLTEGINGVLPMKYLN